MSEFHIIIAWNKANITNNQIIDCFSDSLRLKKIIYYAWDEAYALNNFAAFYGEKLEDIRYKVEHCGAGPFRVFLIEDLEPRYDNRKTSSGIRKININLFDLKTKLRKITGGGHRIHGSDSVSESNLNSISLFGHGLGAIVNNPNLLELTNDSYIHRNLTGALGWKNWEEFFSTLSLAVTFVVLRNYDNFKSVNNTIHGDTDLLVDDFNTAVTVSVAKKSVKGKNRVLYTTIIAGKEELIDFRSCGDGYYCEEWEQAILARRIQYTTPYVMIPCKNDYRYSLLYHALVQKPFMAEDYKETLISLFGTIERAKLKEILDAYMTTNHYKYSKPKDGSVYIHPDYFSKIDVSLYHKIIGYLKFLKYRKLS